MKINSTNLDKIQLPKHGQKFFYDSELKGFGVKAMPSGLMFIAQRKVNGKVIRHVLGRLGEITPAQARNKAAIAIAAMRDGVNLNEAKKQSTAQQITLARAYSDFKNSRQLRPRTLETYDGTVQRCLLDWLDKPLISITKDMIEKQHKQISNTPGVRGNREAVANSAMRILRTVFNYANATYEDADGKSLMPENPVKRLTQIRAWNKIPRRQDVIQQEDLQDWYQSVMQLENTTVRDYLLLCLFTGLRRTEAMKLKWNNVDFKKTKTLTIPATDTKNHDVHQLPLSDFLVEMFNERSKVRRIDNNYVFPAEQGNGHIVEPKRVIAKVIEKSKVKFSMHTLRRTFETTAERLDLPYYALKRLLNHRLPNDVTSGYIVTSVDRLKEPMKKISECLKEQLGITYIQAKEQANA